MQNVCPAEIRVVVSHDVRMPDLFPLISGNHRNPLEACLFQNFDLTLEDALPFYLEPRLGFLRIERPEIRLETGRDGASRRRLLITFHKRRFMLLELRLADKPENFF